MEVEALVESWQPTKASMLYLDSDKVARDPGLLVASAVGLPKGSRRLFSRSSDPPRTAIERYAEAYRRLSGPREVSSKDLEEAAHARVHLVDVPVAGIGLEHGSHEHHRLASLSLETRAELLGRVLEEVLGRWDEFIRAGAAEGRTRSGMDWELDRLRAYLSHETLHAMAASLEDRVLIDGTTLVETPLGTVAAVPPTTAPLSRAVLCLASSFMGGNHTVMLAPQGSPLTTMLLARVADDVLRDRNVEALTAFVPEDEGTMLSVLSESPRVQGLVLFDRGEPEREAAARASARGCAVVSAWAGLDVAIVWDTARLEDASVSIVRGRFTDAGLLPGAVECVVVHRDARDSLVQALGRHINDLRVGLASDPSTDIGPILSFSVLEHDAQVVDEAVELGARVVHGGQRINWRSEADEVGLHFQPTLVDDCEVGMRIVNEALHGPVLPVVSVADVDEVARVVGAMERPGRVRLWATSRAERERLMERIRTPGFAVAGRGVDPERGTRALSDGWGAFELIERLTYTSWVGPPAQ